MLGVTAFWPLEFKWNVPLTMIHGTPTIMAWETIQVVLSQNEYSFACLLMLKSCFYPKMTPCLLHCNSMTKTKSWRTTDYIEKAIWKIKGCSKKVIGPIFSRWDAHCSCCSLCGMLCCFACPPSPMLTFKTISFFSFVKCLEAFFFPMFHLKLTHFW